MLGSASGLLSKSLFITNLLRPVCTYGSSPEDNIVTCSRGNRRALRMLVNLCEVVKACQAFWRGVSGCGPQAQASHASIQSH